MRSLLLRSQLISGIILVLSCGVIPAQHLNVMISNTGDPNEPSIAINPANTDQLMAGSNLDFYYYSTDGGYTWSGAQLSCPAYGVWGDPVIACDTAGNFYFFHLSNPPPPGNWIDRIVCQRTAGPGLPWTTGTFTGLNLTKNQDKHWVDINPQTNEIVMTWTEFDDYSSTAPNDSSRILFSKSGDLGNTWSAPVKINQVSGDCLDEDNTTEGAVPAYGPNGEIYVAWTGPAGLVFDRSLDGGVTWLNQDIPVAAVPGGWDFNVPGIYRCNGLPVTVCDRSGGPNNGTIYINWSDQRNGLNNTDVFLVKSTDQGNTWSSPVKVNNDVTATHQFFNWMAIDQATGYLWFVFYDRRNYTDNMTDVYMAISKDGGQTFSNFKISTTPFLPNASVFFGDYTNLTVSNNVVRPIWTRLDNFQLSIWTAIVDTAVIFTNLISPTTPLIQSGNYPNPFADETAIAFKLRKPATVSIYVYDMRGRKVATLMESKKLDADKHILHFNALSLGLNAGTYNYEIRSDQVTIRRKMIFVK